MDEDALDRVRHALGLFNYVTYGTMSDAAARVEELALRVSRFTNSHIAALNTQISEMRMGSNETKLIFR